MRKGGEKGKRCLDPCRCGRHLRFFGNMQATQERTRNVLETYKFCLDFAFPLAHAMCYAWLHFHYAELN